MNILTFLKLAAELNPQTGTEIRSISSSIKNRINRVKSQINSRGSSDFNSSPGTQGPVPEYTNNMPSSSPKTNMGMSAPGSIPSNPQVQQFQNSFAPATNAPRLFTPRQ